MKILEHKSTNKRAIMTLRECASSGCTHPSFEVPSAPNVEFSTYWSRRAVGVKIDRKYFSNKKAQGKGKAQMAYFGGPHCPCTYAAYVMAGVFVPRMHYTFFMDPQPFLLSIKNRYKGICSIVYSYTAYCFVLQLVPLQCFPTNAAISPLVRSKLYVDLDVRLYDLYSLYTMISSYVHDILYRLTCV